MVAYHIIPKKNWLKHVFDARYTPILTSISDRLCFNIFLIQQLAIVNLIANKLKIFKNSPKEISPKTEAWHAQFLNWSIYELCSNKNWFNLIFLRKNTILISFVMNAKFKYSFSINYVFKCLNKETLVSVVIY